MGLPSGRHIDPSRTHRSRAGRREADYAERRVRLSVKCAREAEALVDRLDAANPLTGRTLALAIRIVLVRG